MRVFFLTDGRVYLSNCMYFTCAGTHYFTTIAEFDDADILFLLDVESYLDINELDGYDSQHLLVVDKINDDKFDR